MRFNLVKKTNKRASHKMDFSTKLLNAISLMLAFVILQSGCTSTSSTTSDRPETSPSSPSSSSPQKPSSQNGNESGPTNSTSSRKPGSNDTNNRAPADKPSARNSGHQSPANQSQFPTPPKPNSGQQKPNTPLPGHETIPNSNTSTEPKEDVSGWETSNQIPTARKQEANSADMPKIPGTHSDEVLETDNKLDEALEALDGDILAQREILREMSDGKVQQEGYTSGPLEAPRAKTNRSSGAEDSKMPGQTTVSMPRNRTAPNTNSSSQADIPKDIPDAKDDDIVARQLRDAAMHEEDPVLKEKLWDEYRKYKNI